MSDDTIPCAWPGCSRAADLTPTWDGSPSCAPVDSEEWLPACDKHDGWGPLSEQEAYAQLRRFAEKQDYGTLERYLDAQDARMGAICLGLIGCALNTARWVDPERARPEASGDGYRFTAKVPVMLRKPPYGVFAEPTPTLERVTFKPPERPMPAGALMRDEVDMHPAVRVLEDGVTLPVARTGVGEYRALRYPDPPFCACGRDRTSCAFDEGAQRWFCLGCGSAWPEEV